LDLYYSVCACLCFSLIHLVERTSRRAAGLDWTSDPGVLDSDSAFCMVEALVHVCICNRKCLKDGGRCGFGGGGSGICLLVGGGVRLLHNEESCSDRLLHEPSSLRLKGQL
jgi:hypothetical protein